jgi:hypothetical protein
MIDTSPFFRCNGSTFEVFVTGLSHTFSRLVREHQTELVDDGLWRINWITEVISAPVIPSAAQIARERDPAIKIAKHQSHQLQFNVS